MKVLILSLQRFCVIRKMYFISLIAGLMFKLRSRCWCGSRVLLNWHSRTAKSSRSHRISDFLSILITHAVIDWSMIGLFNRSLKGEYQYLHGREVANFSDLSGLIVLWKQIITQIGSLIISARHRGGHWYLTRGQRVVEWTNSWTEIRTVTCVSECLVGYPKAVETDHYPDQRRSGN